MLTTEELEILSYTSEIGCCKRCSMRMLCRNVDFNELNVPFDREIKDENVEGSKSKKAKTNPCIVCLDILEESFITELVSNIPLNEVKAYDRVSCVCQLSAPAAVIIREHNIKCHLKEKFPKFYSDDKMYVRPINKVWKRCISKHLDDVLEGKKLEDKSLLSLKFNLEYASDVQETSVMIKLDPETFKRRTHHPRQFNNSVFSRASIEESLSKFNTRSVNTFVTSPPSIPTHRVQCKSVEIQSEAIYIAGRYCKYSRTIGQTPWVHENTNITDCVQDFIFRALEKFIGCDKKLLTFSASGREDYDVRCLGKGRPFYIQMNDPKLTRIPFNTFRAIEKDINVSKEISVKDLQLVNKSDLKKIKEGEQFKTKHYTALCITEADDVEKVVSTLNNYGPFEIEQHTPIRVLHRRNLDQRKRKVYEMKAEKVDGKDNMFLLNVLTQAGTYIKELVHSDLNRTTPSITSILGANTDILALDVNSINLDWPPEIEPSLTENVSSEKEVIDADVSHSVCDSFKEESRSENGSLKHEIMGVDHIVCDSKQKEDSKPENGSLKKEVMDVDHIVCDNEQKEEPKPENVSSEKEVIDGGVNHSVCDSHKEESKPESGSLNNEVMNVDVDHSAA